MTPPVGWIFSSMTLLLKADVDETSLTGRIAAGLDTYAVVENLIALYAFEKEIFGARPSVGVFLPVGYAKVEIDFLSVEPPGMSGRRQEDGYGVGDLTAIPLSLFWEFDELDLHVNAYELVVIPSGQYDNDDIVNMSRNYWSFDTVVATTWLSEKTGTEISAVQGLMANTENEQTD